jgi:hypothetical protein
MKYSEKDIETLFTYHNPMGLDPKRFDEIREAAKFLGKMILKHGGVEVEKERAIMKLRESVFYAIASIVVPKLGE